jgi:glutamine synthetase
MVTKLEKEMSKKGTDLSDAMRKLLAEEVHTFKRIVFNGDNYTEEWVKEAEKRGLLNMKATMDALPSLVQKKNVALFEKYKVLSRREMESRHEIALEQYFKQVNIEGETCAELASTMIVPAATRYLSDLLTTAERAGGLGVKAEGVMSTAKAVNALVDELTDKLAELVEQNRAKGGDDVHAKAEHMFHDIVPAMREVRDVVDQLEKVVPDDYWPMPKYREMLFVK